MEVVLNKIKESQKSIFITGIAIGLMFGLIFGVIIQGNYDVYMYYKKKYVHQKKMQDLEYLEKLVKIKKDILKEPLGDVNAPILYETVYQLDSIFIKNLKSGLR